MMEERKGGGVGVGGGVGGGGASLEFIDLYLFSGMFTSTQIVARSALTEDGHTSKKILRTHIRYQR